METERNWKLVLVVIGVIAAVMIVLMLSGRGSTDDDPQQQSLPLPTSTSASATTTPMDKLIQEEILPPPNQGEVTPSTSSVPVPPGCKGTNCHGSDQVPVDGWEQVVIDFADAYGTIGNNTREQWLDGIRSYTSPGMFSQLERADYDRMKPGGKADIRLVKSDDPHTVVARINYPEGWSIYVQLTNRGTAFGGWQVDTIDTPRSGQ